MGSLIIGGISGLNLRVTVLAYRIRELPTGFLTAIYNHRKNILAGQQNE
jgi:hypothetical protein